MQVFFHVAPADAASDILKHGIRSLMCQHGYDASDATDAYVERWSARTGRDAESVLNCDCINEDLESVCAFTDISAARAWAAVEPVDMVIVQITDEGDLIEAEADEYAADIECGVAVRLRGAGDQYNTISARLVQLSIVK